MWACLLWLLGPCAILLAAGLLRPGEGRTVLLPLIDRAVPETCTMQRSLGVDCPGCGLTRSFIHMARGNVRRAWGLHPIGVFLFIYVFLQLPLAGSRLAGLDHPWLNWLIRNNERMLIAAAIALAGYWLYRVGTGEIF